MPTMTNLTVKKADGTTDVVYNMLTQSAGDRSPATWRSESQGTVPGQKPVLTMVAQPSAQGKTRRMDLDFTFKQVYTETTTGLSRVANQAKIKVEVHVPVDMPQTAIDEAISQGLNLLGTTNVRDSIKAGFAPN